jgi:hypothetical protein
MIKDFGIKGRHYWLSTKFVLLAPILGIISCKPTAQVSQSKSLDNFTRKDGARLTFNSCSGSQAVNAPDNKLYGSSSQVSAIKTALSAVPAELQNAFFRDLKGSIHVAKDINKVCGDKIAKTTNADDLLACWRGSEAGISIFIKEENASSATERNIKHSTVRMMGYVLTDVILKVKNSSGEALIADNPALVQIKKDVAEALTRDTKKSKDHRIPSSLASDETSYNDAAFAEAFDSYYCSVKSRSTMASNFPETFEIFAEIAALLPQGLAGTLDQSSEQGQVETSNSSINNQTSFSLWGRWGRGNGPLRQGFSNWRSYRSSGGGFMNFRRWNSGGRLFFR